MILGTPVRRIHGKYLTDDEMIDYYSNLARQYGDLKATYKNAICLAMDEGHIYEALFRFLAELPFRGPEEYSEGDYTCQCQVNGDFAWFQGYETISFQGQCIYECYFHGDVIKK